MASLMENLIDVLDRESTEYEALLQLSQRKTPIIAGGLISDKESVMAALSAGAIAVSSTNHEVWKM